MTETGSTLASKAEAAIRRLRDVDGVSVRAEGADILEIHVLTSSAKTPKNIVRDVQTVLRTGLGVSIDHRVVSVALAGPERAAKPPGPAPTEPEPADAALAAAAQDPAGAAVSEPLDRIRFEGVNLYVAGARTQVQVELRWRGLPRIGSASGLSARDEAHRLVAQATAAAVQEFLSDPVTLNVHAVEFVGLGRNRAVVVALTLLAHRQEKILTGTCIVDQDTPQAVVLATLSALNRLVGGLRVKEPTEYVLRSTSH